jgi:hypothetical protein
MQLKSRRSLSFVILVLLVLLLSSLTISRQQLTTIKADLTEKLMSTDIGISYFRNLSDTGANGSENPTFSNKFISLVKSMPEIIEYKLFNENNLDVISIDINFSDYLVLMKDRYRAIKNTKLSNPNKVNAKLTFRGKTYKARVRIKGDLPDHWTSKHRISLRIELKNNKTILGFNKFSIQKPLSRQHPYDYTFQSMVRDTGNLASIHKFAYISVNGDDWGIMDVEEHASKWLLEKQNRKSSIIVRFSNEDKWLYEITSEIPYGTYRMSDPLLFLKLYNKKSLKNIHNRKIYSYISNNRLSNNKNIYDIDSFSKALIISLAWNNMHTLADANSRYYFNPYTLKLEPITTDQGYWEEIKGNNDLGADSKYISILSGQTFVDRLPENLKKVSQVILNIDEHLSYPQSLFPVDKKKNTDIVKNNMKKIIDNQKKYLIDPIEKYNSERKSNNEEDLIKQLILPTKQQASEFEDQLHIKHYTDGTLELYNLLPDNVAVQDILFNGKSIAINNTIVPSYLSHPEPTIIKTPYKGIQDGMFTINTEYQGFDRKVKNNITLVSDGINNPLLLNTANEFYFINKLDGNTYEIKQGNWIVNKPIIVNGDLHISPGVNLQFSKNAYIIVKGSLTAIGGESNPITLKAISDSWKGIYVLNADKKSHLKNVNISNLSALEDELLKLTGGITFYKSDVDFENVRINDIKAEDALNIVESKFSLNSVYINNTVSDGLDSDFSKGSVSNSEFSNVGGDALDFSGSNVSIVATEASNIKDKAVSAGEKSTLNIKNSTFNNVGVGIASKDGSSVTASNTTILNYALYGVMTYLKKDFYDMPSLTINNSSVSNGRAYIRQKGTSMTVDGVNIPETKISVKKLYKTKVMAK